jgi:hypothetical protein
MERIYLGKCGVDSGRLLITDPCYIDKVQKIVDESKDEILAICKDDSQALNFEHGEGLGVTFASGYGDGLYSVYGYKNSDDRIIKVEIIMGEHLINNKGEVITDYDETERLGQAVKKTATPLNEHL